MTNARTKPSTAIRSMVCTARGSADASSAPGMTTTGDELPGREDLVEDEDGEDERRRRRPRRSARGSRSGRSRAPCRTSGRRASRARRPRRNRHLSADDPVEAGEAVAATTMTTTAGYAAGRDDVEAEARPGVNAPLKSSVKPSDARQLKSSEAPRKGRGQPESYAQLAAVGGGLHELAEDIEEAAGRRATPPGARTGRRARSRPRARSPRRRRRARRRSPQAVAEAVDRLVVEAVDLDLVDSERRVEPRAGLDVHRRGEDARARPARS